MSCLGSIQDEIRAHLRGAGFLRRDRDARALFITDYPLRNDDAPAVLEALTGAGFAVTCERGLWRIDLSPWRQAALIDSLPRAAACCRRGMCLRATSPGRPSGRRFCCWPRETGSACGRRYPRKRRCASARMHPCPPPRHTQSWKTRWGEKGKRFFLEPRKKKLVVT